MSDFAKDTNVPTNDCISRQAATDALIFESRIVDGHYTEYERIINEDDAIEAILMLPSAEPETCDGCKHWNLWEDEIEYGYPSPCTICKRRVNDNYER